MYKIILILFLVFIGTSARAQSGLMAACNPDGSMTCYGTQVCDPSMCDSFTHNKNGLTMGHFDPPLTQFSVASPLINPWSLYRPIPGGKKNPLTCPKAGVFDDFKNCQPIVYQEIKIPGEDTPEVYLSGCGRGDKAGFTALPDCDILDKPAKLAPPSSQP